MYLFINKSNWINFIKVIAYKLKFKLCMYVIFIDFSILNRVTCFLFQATIQEAWY